MSSSGSPLPLPLPDGWSPLESVGDTVVAAGVSLQRAGLASTSPGGIEITGSAAEREQAPAARAGFELLERIATVEALSETDRVWEMWTPAREPAGELRGADAFPQVETAAQWRFARSNGVALHRDWASACFAARAELAERDRVLTAWYGDILPAAADLPQSIRHTEGYVWRAVLLPAGDGSWSADLSVAAVVGLPIVASDPIVLGYGADPTPDGALERAGREALQSLAFLWGETIPEVAPEPTPTAAGHLEHWLYPRNHDWLRAWLDGEHARFRGRRTKREGSATVRYVDLTPAWFTGGLCVAKAVCPRAEPLAFGLAPFGEHLPPELRIHPIV